MAESIRFARCKPSPVKLKVSFALSDSVSGGALPTIRMAIQGIGGHFTGERSSMDQ